MIIEVDVPKCVASGQCVIIAPDVFDQDDDGMVVLLRDNPAADQYDAVREAASICPAAVIRLIES